MCPFKNEEQRRRNCEKEACKRGESIPQQSKEERSLTKDGTEMRIIEMSGKRATKSQNISENLSHARNRAIGSSIPLGPVFQSLIEQIGVSVLTTNSF